MEINTSHLEFSSEPEEEISEEIEKEIPKEIYHDTPKSPDVTIPDVSLSSKTFEKSEKDFSEDNFEDVLQLTEYSGTPRDTSVDFVVAEYDKIDTKNVEKKHTLTAKRFVEKITKFILEFNDVQLSEAHKSYLRQVGQLQLDNLKDLLSLVDINKQMIDNIVARVNATQAEDYAIINSYNNLINQHIKLIKELSNMYKAIPSVMKKMRADILSNQELESTSASEELITEDFNETQFNNSKQMLRKLLEKRRIQESTVEKNTEN